MSEPDPQLRRLEGLLAAEQQRSRDAEETLRDLSRRELEIARERLPVAQPPSAAMGPPPPGGWTVDTAMAHLLALRQADREFYAERFRAEEKFQGERDRRYAEVATEREKALKIKETADLAALSLAREIQDYKDEKANELRTQIERERGQYPTRAELAAAMDKIEGQVKPLSDYVTAQQGGPRAITAPMLIAALGAVVLLVTLYLAFRP